MTPKPIPPSVGSIRLGSLAADSVPGPSTPPSSPTSATGGPTAPPGYRVVRLLGRGGMGDVYLVHNETMDRPEVLKVVQPELLSRPGFRERFQQEVRNAARLHHPNIVTAYCCLPVGDGLALALEYVPGRDLYAAVRADGPMPVVAACHYARQAALGLQHAHEQGMVHRDVKPHNLMLGKDGTKPVVKVLDFGLAKVVKDGSFDGGLTGANQMMGTPEYVAPEQILDAAKADTRADVYGLGCTLYYLLAGRSPFAGLSLFETLEAHHFRQPAPVHTLRPDVPAELDAVLAKMLAKEPADRYQTPGEAAVALTPFLKVKGAKTGPPRAVPFAEAVPTQTGGPTVGPMRVRKRRSVWPWVAGVGAALALAVGGLWAGGVFAPKARGAVVALDVSQPDAEVFVDGEPRTITWAVDRRRAEIALPAGQHTVEVRKAGFAVYRTDVSLAADERRPVLADLSPLAAVRKDAIIPEPKPPEPKPKVVPKVPAIARQPLTSSQLTFAGRTEPERTRQLGLWGGTAESEAAVARGLTWLARQQKADGSWEYGKDAAADPVGPTGLALLAFLGAGHTHQAGDHKAVVEAGLKFLLARPAADGRNLYGHALATTALCEALGMTGDRTRLLGPARKAVEAVVAAQAADGSWGAAPGQPGNLVTVAVQVEALAAARMARDIVIPAETWRRASRFLDGAAAGPTKGRFGYKAADPLPHPTALGLFVRFHADGWGPDTPGMADGVGYLLGQPAPRKETFDPTRVYYQSQAVRYYQGPEWHRTWNPPVRDLLVALQSRTAEAGSWDLPPAGRLAGTCYAVLILETYYRHTAK